MVTRGVKTDIWHATTVHFREYRLEPPRMLIVDADRPLGIPQSSSDIHP
jgi:hypothetical protein